MNRGYKIYYKEAKRIAKKTLKKKGNIFKFYLRGLLSLIGKLTIIVSPICGLADVRAAKYAKDNNDIVVMKSFASGDDTKPYWSVILAGLYRGMIWLAGLILIALLALVVFVSSAALGNILNYNQQMLLIIVCMIPVGFILISYLIVFPLYARPMNYVIDTLGGKATDAVGKSYNAMRYAGKRTLFKNDFMACLKLIFVGIIIFVVMSILVSVSQTFIGKQAFGYAFLPLIILVAAKSVARILLARSITEILLFEDIVLDKYTNNKVLKGINVVKVKRIKKNVNNIQDNLIRLFDETKEVKSADEFDNDQFDEVFNQEAKEVVSTIHKVNETEEEKDYEVEELPLEELNLDAVETITTESPTEVEPVAAEEKELKEETPAVEETVVEEKVEEVETQPEVVEETPVAEEEQPTEEIKEVQLEETTEEPVEETVAETVEETTEETVEEKEGE